MKEELPLHEKWDLRGLAVGVFLGTTLVLGAFWLMQSPREAVGQQPAADPRLARGQGGELVVFALPAKDGVQHVTVVDPRTKVIGHYLLDSGSGEISLKGVRRIDGDLLMEEFNSTSPTPREIRALLGR